MWFGFWEHRNQVPERHWLLVASTAAGNGSMEERLLRLMVWVATVTGAESTPSHLTNPVEILQDGRAWCDQQCAIFMWCLGRLYDLKTSRQRELRHSDGHSGHTICEVFYEGAWHLFDVASDHQAIYRYADGHLLSYEELVEDPTPIHAENHWWRGGDGTGKVGFYRPDSCTLVCDYEVLRFPDPEPPSPPILPLP